MPNFNALPKRIVATFGGHDARDLTQHFIDNIPHLPDYCSVDIIIGSDLLSKFSVYSRQVKLLRVHKKVAIHARPSNYYQILSKADIGVCSGGLSIFEFASIGIASIGLPQYMHQLITILKLEKDGICLLGSNNMNLSNEKFNSTLKKFSKKIKMPGFRSGKIPRERLLKQFQPNIEADFMESNFQKYYPTL